jgi:predicted GNAT superfamily acetyltransferase
VIVLRELRTAAELAPLPELEVRVWGGQYEMVSVNVLVATISEGGVAIGAFHGDRLVGAVYGFATSDPAVHHSHYLAVDVPYRRTGLGERLKHAQRDWCLARGITAMRWTYDPLQYGNAHLNLRRLGAVGLSYHVDHYGALGGINGSLPSDRVTVRWELDGAASRDFAEQRVVPAPAITAADIAAAAGTARVARLELRAALQPLLDAGWTIVDVDRGAPSYTVAR